MEEKDLEFYIGEARRAGLSGASAQRFFAYSGLDSDGISAAMDSLPSPQFYIAPEPQEDPQEESKEKSRTFNPMTEKGLDMFSDYLPSINQEVLGKGEKEAVQLLRNQFNRYGFQFDEAVPGFDFVNVTAPNGQKKRFNFKPGLPTDTDPNDFTAPTFSYDPEKAKAEASEMISFMNKNMIEDRDEINALARKYFPDTPEFANKEEVKRSIEYMEERTTQMNERVMEYESMKAGDVKPESLVSFRNLERDLKNDLMQFREESEGFNSELGRYVARKSDQGTWVGAAYNELMGGMDDIIKGSAGVLGDIILNIEERDPAIRDARQKAMRKDLNSLEAFNAVWGTKSTSDEYVQSIYENSIIGGGLLGAIRSIPAFAVPSGRIGSMVALTSQVLSGLDREMSGKEFDGVTENEKYLLKAPLSIATAALERFGFRNIQKLSSLAPRLVARAFRSKGKNLTAKSFAEIVEQDIKNGLARGLLTAGNAFVSEFETGVLQEGTGQLMKIAWNSAQGSNQFKVPETLGQAFKQIAIAGLQEGIGGFAMGAPTVYSSVKYNFTDAQMAQFELIRNPIHQMAVRRSIQNKLAAGEITNEEAANQLENINNIIKAMEGIPSDFDLSTKKQLFRKNQQRISLENKVKENSKNKKENSKNKKGERKSREEKALDKLNEEISAITEKGEKVTQEQANKEIIEAISKEDGGKDSTEVEDGDGDQTEVVAEDQTPEDIQSTDDTKGPDPGDTTPVANDTPDNSAQEDEEEANDYDETKQQDVEESETLDPNTPDNVESFEDDRVEVDTSSATQEELSEAGFDTTTASVAGRVIEALEGNELPGGKVVQHNTENSLRKAAAKHQGKPLIYDNVIYGFVAKLADGTRQIHLMSSSALTETGMDMAPSTTDLVVEEIITHFALESLMSNDAFRSQLYDKIIELGRSSPRLQKIIDERLATYGDKPKREREEEVIAGFFVDYVKAPEEYRSFTQRIIDFINSILSNQTIRVSPIKDQAGLLSFARQVANLAGGKKTKIESSPQGSNQSSQNTISPSSQTRSGKKRFNYLENTTIYFDFNRNFGVPLVEWANPSPPKPKKIKVKDFYHFRNWYNKQTSNGVHAGIVTNMYRLDENGNKRVVNPPKPRLDENGLPVKMDRIPTFGDLKSARAKEERDNTREFNIQYSILSKEVSALWLDSPFRNYTYMSDFIPDGEPLTERDYEGLIIAKKNIQATIDLNLTEEQVKELVTNRNFGVIEKSQNPELFNMSGLTRSNDYMEPGTTYDPDENGVMFSSQKRSYDRQAPRAIEFDGDTSDVGDIELMPGIGLVVKYDMAGTATYELEYGDLKEEYTTEGGTQQLDSLSPELQAIGAAISHATADQRSSTSRRGKVLWTLYNHNGTAQPMTDEQIEKFMLGKVNEIKAKLKKAKTDGKTKAVQKLTKELEVAKKEAAAAVERAKQIRDELVKSKGQITVPIHLNDPKNLAGRKDVFNSLLDFAFKIAETDPTVAQALLDEINEKINKKLPGSSKGYQKIYTKATIAIGNEGNGWRVTSDGITITTIAGARRIFLDDKGMGLKDRLNMKQRNDLFQSLNFYQKKRKEEFKNFPDLQKQFWRQVIEPHYYKNLEGVLGSSVVSVSGYALKAYIIDINKMYNEEGVPIHPEGIQGTNFGYFTAGLVKTVRLSRPLILEEKTSNRNSSAEELSISLIDKGDFELQDVPRSDPGTPKTVDKLIEKYETSRINLAQVRDKLDTLTGRYMFGGKTVKVSTPAAFNLAFDEGQIMFSMAAGRVSGKVSKKAGPKGVSVNQIMQVAGKASNAEQLVLAQLMDRFPGVEFIPKEEFDAFFEAKMLQPLDEEKSHSSYGLDRLHGRKARRLKAVTVPFIGDPGIYGTPGIFEDHFSFPVHAHIRMFVDPDAPGVLYVSELQSDTYQKGLEEAYDGTITEEVVIEDYASDEVDVAVQNLPFLKYILENYDEFRAGLIEAAGGRDNAIKANWWDNILAKVEVVPEGRLGDAPNMGSLLSNALANDPNFNVRAFRVLLRQYAMSNLKAPVNSTSKQIDDIINDHFNKYPYVQPGERNDLGSFSKDLVISIDYMADTVSDIALGEGLIGMTPEQRMKVYDGAVEAVENHRNEEKEEKIEAIPSARKSWEKQLIRYAIRRAQQNGDGVVRFPTENTAADIQWWDANDVELNEYMSEEFGVERLGMFDGEMGGETLVEEKAKQVPLRKRYRNLPKTLKSIGLDSRLVRDEAGNSWYEVETPAPDTRMTMFSQQSRSNMGEIGGATWEARQRTSTEEWTDLWLTRLQDKYRKVFQIQEDVSKKTKGQVEKDQDFRMAEELMYGKAANDLELLSNATDAISNSLRDNGLTVEDLDQYMYALHVKERNAVIRDRTEGKNENGSGKTDEWAEKVIADMDPAKKQKLEQSAQIVRGVLQDTRNMMVELGLESQETIDAFEEMFENYVPLQGKSIDEEDMTYSPYPNGGTGFSVSGATTKKAKGRFTESTNIVAQVIAQNAAVKIKGRTNETMNTLYNLALNNPNSAVWEVLDKEEHGYKSDDPNIVSVRVNGVQKAIRFKDASYAQALRSMNMPQKNYFVRAMGSINSWLRAAFTSRNPEFILGNFSRDIQAAVFNASAESEIEGGFLNGTGAMKQIFKLVGPSLKALVKDEIGANTDQLIMKYYQEFKEDGGKTGWAYQKSLEDIAKELEVDDSGRTGAQKVIGGLKGVLEFVEGMNDAFENSIRLSAYIAAREGGVSREKAAQFAKNITVNFNKQGEWGAAVNSTYLFFNASIQGTARLGRSLTNLKPPMRPDGSKREWYYRATTAQKAALGMILVSGLLTLLNRAASDEDEDGTLFYNKIPDYVKERNLIIMRPDGKNFWKIPMPYGYNIFANIGSTSVEVASGDKQALEGLAFMAMSLVNAFSPVSFGQADSMGRQLAKTSIPTAFKPFFEAFAFNETYFGGPVKAEQYPFGTPKPNSSMSFRSPEEMKQFFSWLNEATGGSENVPGVIDINPDGGWYIFEYFLGGTGKFVTRSIETGRKIVADREESPIDLDFNDIPFMRIVYGEPSKYYDMQLYKDREVEIKQLTAEFKDNRIPNAGDRYKNVSPLNDMLKSINKRLKAVRAQKKSAKKLSGYSERVSKIQLLQEEERKLVMMFNKRYEELRGQN